MIRRITERPGPVREHELKCDERQYAAIVSGRKRFEFRLNDRPGGFLEGDVLVLHEYMPSTVGLFEGGYTGKFVRVRVAHLLCAPNYGVPDGHVVMSIDRLDGLPDVRTVARRVIDAWHNRPTARMGMEEVIDWLTDMVNKNGS